MAPRSNALPEISATLSVEAFQDETKGVPSLFRYGIAKKFRSIMGGEEMKLAACPMAAPILSVNKVG
jgi:hypothetical protein